MTTDKTIVIIYRESFLQAVCSDIVTSITLFLPLFVNYIFIGGSKLITAFILILWLLMASGRLNKMALRFHNVEDLQKFVNTLKKKEEA